ncbi:MAG: hypothetical protein WCT77_02900 [Bacteroidota bacterium]
MKIEQFSIIKHQHSYWMIMEDVAHHSIGITLYYSVQKCSKKGKLYKEKNGFSQTFIQDIFNTGIGLVRVGGIPEHANLEDGIASSKRKRRISFLQARIKEDTKEIEKLLSEV